MNLKLEVVLIPRRSIQSSWRYKTIAYTAILHSLQPYFIVNDTFGMHRITDVFIRD